MKADSAISEAQFGHASVLQVPFRDRTAGRMKSTCAVTPERAFNLHSMVLQLVVEVARIRVEPQSRRDPLPSLLEDRPVLVFGPRAASFPCRRFSWRMLILVEAARNAHRHLQLRERQRFERNGTDWSGQDILEFVSTASERASR
eukprot:scaffold1806_cov240-Pinguiococcus_pyrenoidosus.AAC.17